MIISETSAHKLELLHSALHEAHTTIDALQNELLTCNNALKEVRGKLGLAKA